MYRVPQLVKPPQSRHGKGHSVVYLSSGASWGLENQRVYVKTQIDYYRRPAWRAWRRTPTFMNEYRALTACRKLGLAVPRVVSFRYEGNVAELVVQEVADSVSLDALLSLAHGERRRRVVAHLGYLVGQLHGHGWVHGSLGSPHILVQPQANDRLWLIDLEKARRSRRLIEIDLARFWHRNPCMDAQDKRYFDTSYAQALSDHNGRRFRKIVRRGVDR